MGKVHRSKQKAVEYLYQQDILTLGKTDSKATYKELLDVILEPQKVRKGAPFKSNTVYINRRQKYDIHYNINRINVEAVKDTDTFKIYSHLYSALMKTLKHYPIR